MPEQAPSALAGSTIAVTGATGFIGRRLVRALSSEDAEVIALSRNVPENMRGLEGTRWVEWDLESDADNHVLSQLRKASSIVHLAAYIPRDKADASEASRCLRINALGTLKVLQAAEKAGISRFVNLSSGQLYAYSETPVGESFPVTPTARATYYLTSKLVGEHYVEHFWRGGGLSTLNLRPGSVYGPGMPCHATIYRLIESVLSDEVIRVVDAGRYGVDLVYVDDVVSFIGQALKMQIAGTYNVGSGRTTTFAELVAAIATLCPDCSPVIEQVPGAEQRGFSALDITKAHTEIGYEPLDLDEGLARTIASVRDGRTASAVPGSAESHV